MLAFAPAASSASTMRARQLALCSAAPLQRRLLHQSCTVRASRTLALHAEQQKPRTLQLQALLPRLPLPPLEQTVARYLKSLEPIFAQKEELGQLPSGATAASELAKRKAWAEEFLADNSIAHTLQQRLRDVDATTPNNWLDDRFWLQKAYHEWRVPLLINSNWWLMFAPDTSLQTEADITHAGDASSYASASLADLASISQDTGKPIDYSALLGPARWESLDLGLRRAAWLTWRFVEFKTRLDAEDIAPDVTRAGAFCMNQYTNVYGVTRIPALPHDWNTRPAPPTVAANAANASDPPANFITVIIRNNFYELQVIDSETGKILSPQAIEDGLKALVEDAKTRPDGPGVGVLSSDARDTWAQAREHLLRVSEQNIKSIESIQRSLFALSIDTSVLPQPSGHDDPVAVSPSWVDAHARNENGTGRGGHNRWFDKSLSLIVEPNGRAGILGEHSPVDALIPGIMADYASLIPTPPPGQPFPSVDTTSNDQIARTSARFTRRDFDVDTQTTKEIETSTRNALALAADSDARALWYDEYGAEWIKKVAKVSPDAYLQTVLQVAMALTHGSQTPTYETASTRFFRNGRTDVIRSFSTESYEFVRALVRGSGEDPATLYQKLVKACTSHTAQTRDSSFGKGIDRHLTGLRLVFDGSRDGSVPSLLGDEAFGASQTWTLSTSGLSAGDRIAGTGFGAGYPDGYGCNYLAGGKLLKFGLESKRSTPTTSTTKFAQNVVKALRLMRDITEKGAAASTPTS